MIGIRVDANSIISTGHVMRCIAIEQGLEVLGEKCVFLVSDITTSDFLKTKGYESICLFSDWRNKEDELPCLENYIKEYQINKLIVDSYKVTKGYVDRLHQITKVIYLDDLRKNNFSLSMIINYGIDISEKNYNTQKIDGVKLLIGKDFTPLRQEFRNKRIKWHETVSDVMITTGGSDNLHLIEKLLNRIKATKHYDTIRFHIIVGKFFTNQVKLNSLVNTVSNLILYYDVEDMSMIMSKCDIAVSAGGTTLAELCAMGIPTICFAIADNQIDGVNAYQKAKVMLNAGDIRMQQQGEEVAEIEKLMIRLLADNNLRKDIFEKLQTFLDGEGSIRIAEEIIKL